MLVSLKNRFLDSALPPLNAFFKLIGIHFKVRESNQGNLFIRCWGILLLVLCVQSNIYITFKRTKLFNDFFSLLPNAKNFDRELINAILRLSGLVSDVVVHTSLVFNIWPRIESFLAFLESVDYDLKRPNLSQVKRVSLIGLIYTVGMVS